MAVKTIPVDDRAKREQLLNEIRSLVQAAGCPNLVAGLASRGVLQPSAKVQRGFHIWPPAARKQPGAARSIHSQTEAVRSSQEQSGLARSNEAQPEAVRSSQQQPAAASISQDNMRSTIKGSRPVW